MTNSTFFLSMPLSRLTGFSLKFFPGKKIVLCLTLLLGLFQWVSAQNKNYEELVRTSMRADKKAVVAEVMAFNDSTAKVFWPMYNVYEMEYAKLMDERIAIIKEFANAYASMTDEKAAEIMKRSFANKDALTSLMKAWTKKFTKAIGAQKTLTFMQTENKISAMVDYGIASEVPLYQK